MSEPTSPNMLAKFGVVMSPEPTRRRKQLDPSLSDTLPGRNKEKHKDQKGVDVFKGGLDDSFSRAITQVKLDSSKTRLRKPVEDLEDVNIQLQKERIEEKKDLNEGRDGKLEFENDIGIISLGSSPKESTVNLSNTFDDLLRRYNLGGPYVSTREVRKSRSSSLNNSLDNQEKNSKEGEELGDDEKDGTTKADNYKVELETEALAVAYRQALESLLEDHGLNKSGTVESLAAGSAGSTLRCDATESFEDLKKTQKERLNEVQEALHKTTEEMLNSVNDAIGGSAYCKVKSYSDMNPGELMYEKGVLKENIKRVELELGSLQEEECSYRPYITPRAHSMKRVAPVYDRVPGEVEHKKKMISQLKKDFETDDMKECTFKPKLNESSYNYYSGYLLALERSNRRREENKKRLQDEREKEFMKEATFQPKIGNYNFSWNGKNKQKWGNVFDRLDRSVHARRDHLRQLEEERHAGFLYDPVKKRQFYHPQVNHDKRAERYIRKTGRTTGMVHEQLYYHGVSYLKKRQKLENHYKEYCKSLFDSSKVCDKSKRMLRSKLAKAVKEGLNSFPCIEANMMAKQELGDAMDRMGLFLEGCDDDGLGVDRPLSLGYFFHIVFGRQTKKLGVKKKSKAGEDVVTVKSVFNFLMYSWDKGGPSKLNYSTLKEGYIVPKINNTSQFGSTIKTEDIDLCAGKVHELISNSILYQSVRQVERPSPKEFYGKDVFPFTPQTCQTRQAKFLTRNRGTKAHLKNLCNVLYADHWAWERRKESAVAEKESHETDGCTFEPELTIKKKYSSVKSHFNQEEWEKKVQHFCDHRTTSEKALDRCTFSPEIHGFNDKIFKTKDRPWGFHDAIERTYKAREMAREKEEIRNSTGVVKKFRRHEQVPFHLETDVRSRQADLKKQEIGTSENFVLFHANVKFGHRQAIQIPVHPNDDPWQVAKSFVKIQGLRPNLIAPLAEALSSDIQQWCQEYNPREQKRRFLDDLGTHLIPLEEEFLEETFPNIEPVELEGQEEVANAWGKINSIMKSLADEEAVDKKYKDLLDCEIRIQKFREEDEKQRKREASFKEKRRQLMLQSYSPGVYDDADEQNEDSESEVVRGSFTFDQNSLNDTELNDTDNSTDTESFASLSSIRKIYDDYSGVDEAQNHASESEIFINTFDLKPEQNEFICKAEVSNAGEESEPQSDSRKLQKNNSSDEEDYHLFSDLEFDIDSPKTSDSKEKIFKSSEEPRLSKNTSSDSPRQVSPVRFLSDSDADNSSYDGRYDDDTSINDGDLSSRNGGQGGYSSADTYGSYRGGNLVLDSDLVEDSDGGDETWMHGGRNLKAALEMSDEDEDLFGSLPENIYVKAMAIEKERAENDPNNKVLVRAKEAVKQLREKRKEMSSTEGSTFDMDEIADMVNVIDKAYDERSKAMDSTTSLGSNVSKSTLESSFLKNMDNTVPIFDLSDESDWQGRGAERVLYELKEIEKSGNFASNQNAKIEQMKQYLRIVKHSSNSSHIVYEVKGMFIEECVKQNSTMMVEWKEVSEDSNLAQCIGNGLTLEMAASLSNVKADIFVISPSGSKHAIASVESDMV